MADKYLKIRIITIHGIPNFGSVFQTTALCRYLQRCGYEDVRVIDYNPAYFKPHSLRAIGGALLNPPSYLRRSRRYRSYLIRNVPLTERSYSDYADLAAEDFDADVYIAGGDQLWNVYHDCGKDDAYKLTFVRGTKISYGTSMGQSDFSGPELDELAKKISCFSAVSVRESSSVELLASRGIEARHVVDPVFLLDPNDYKDDAIDPCEEPYLLVYLVTPSKLLEDCIAYLSKKHGLQVIQCFGLSKKCTCNKHVKDAGPAELLGYVKNADIILSASFHATAFATMFEKQFFTLLPDEHTNERILDYLSMRGLTGRIITEQSDLFTELDKNIDYEMLPDYSGMINASKQYLSGALDGCRADRGCRSVESGKVK